MDRKRIIQDFGTISGDLSIDSVSKLAHGFKTSYTAMLIRLHELALIDDTERKNLEIQHRAAQCK